MRFKVIAALVAVTALTAASAGVALATSRPSSIAAFTATTPGHPGPWYSPFPRGGVASPVFPPIPTPLSLRATTRNRLIE